MSISAISLTDFVPFSQDIADQVIQSAHASPLALATFAYAVRAKEPTDLTVWKEAEKASSYLFARGKTLPVFGRKYSGSDWSSPRSLSKGAQNLLFLLSLCTESPIPDYVLQVFFESLKLQWATTHAMFAEIQNEVERWKYVTMTSELCEWKDFEVAGSGPQQTGPGGYAQNSDGDRELVRLSDEKASTTSSSLSTLGTNRTSTLPLATESWSYSKLTLRTQFVRHELKEEHDLLISTILGKGVENELGAERPSNEDAFLTILGALYFDKQYVEGLCVGRASKRGIDVEKMGMETRSAIEPLLWLIPNRSRNQQFGYKWEETSSFIARKVILTYACNNFVDDGHVQHLLLSPYSRRATCWALGKMLRSHECPIIGETPYGIIETLLDLQAKELNIPQLPQDVVSLLWTLKEHTSNHKDFDVMETFLTLLEKLENIYQNRPHSHLEAQTAVLLLVADILNCTALKKTSLF